MTKKITWTTRDSVVIPIREMEDSHLVNTIRYLRRTHSARAESWAYSAGDYAAGAADIASMHAESAAISLYALSEDTSDAAVAFLEPRFTVMLREARRRKLVV